jgi:hypothetical protein
LHIFEERPPGCRVKENLLIEYEYDTILSTTATRDIIKGSGLRHGFNPSDIEEYHNADIEMFDKLVIDFRKWYGFRLGAEGEQVY